MNKIKMPVLFLALWALLACHAELTSAVADQVSTSEQELDALRVQLAAARAEIVGLRLKLKSKYEEDQLQDEEEEPTEKTVDKLASWRLLQEPTDEDEDAAVATAVGASDDSELQGGTELPGGICQLNNCESKCAIKPDVARKVDGKCTLEKSYLETILDPSNAENVLKFVGTPELPKWDIRHGDPKAGMRRTVGTVICPCNAGGHVMTEADAVRTIVGQVAAVGIPDQVAKSSLGQVCKGGCKSRAFYWNAKIAMAVIKMVKCWKKKCFQPTNNASGLEELLEGPDGNVRGRPVDLELDDSFGGGQNC